MITKPIDPLDARLEQLYGHRFPPNMRERRIAVWRLLCKLWLARYIAPEARVLEIGAGYCEFINNIKASERIAVDINPETRRQAAPGVTVYEAAAEDLADVLPQGRFDVVFLSNFLEHCRSRDRVLSVLRAAVTVLRPNGRLLVLGPNFRYCYKEYFDYFDHRLPLTEKSVGEALLLVGLKIELVKPRTIPFTFNGRLPSWPWLVAMYLRLPFLWRVFGAQFFIVAKKS